MDGKVVRLYADVENKTIAWKEIKEGSLDELKNVRVFKIDKNNDIVLFSIAKVIKSMNIAPEKLPIKYIPVEEYKDTLVDGVFKCIDLRPFLKAEGV